MGDVRSLREEKKSKMRILLLTYPAFLLVCLILISGITSACCGSGNSDQMALVASTDISDAAETQISFRGLQSRMFSFSKKDADNLTWTSVFKFESEDAAEQSVADIQSGLGVHETSRHGDLVKDAFEISIEEYTSIFEG